MPVLYAWAKPAFVQGSPVDHTWVTSYDSRINPKINITEVISDGENFWYSKGDFHQKGKFIGKEFYSSPFANCLVHSNTKQGRGSGTIFRYGIDGVCHQVSNQVLYKSATTFHNLRVDKARGYKVSSFLYGTYGRKKEDWNRNKSTCTIPNSYSSDSFSLLKSRASSFHGNGIENLIKDLEKERLILLQNINEIGLSRKKIHETPRERAIELNREINIYLEEASYTLESFSNVYTKIFGIPLYTEINIIDPELFQFQD